MPKMSCRSPDSEMKLAKPARLGLALIAFVLAALGPASASERAVPAPVRSAVLAEFADKLEQYFLQPAIGRKYANLVRARERAGAYAGAPAEQLARAVTNDLQAVHPDGHLRLAPPSPAPMLGAPSAKRAEEESAETGIDRSGWIAPGIAFISFQMFPSSKGSLAALSSFLDRHRSARALIVDARVHGGGYPDEIDVLASYLFERPTELIQLDTRAAAFRPKPDTAELVRIRSPDGYVRQSHRAVPRRPGTPLSKAPVLVLTSGYTGSAAEHLALAFQRTGRGTLIGETTAGMGHFGRVVELPRGFSGVIPIGRPFDPTTGRGWEGTGVEPNVQVAAEKALIVALRRLGVPAARAGRLSRYWAPRGSMKRVAPLRTQRSN